MSTILYLVYDGEVFRPEGPVEMLADTRVRVKIEATETAKPRAKSFLRTARSLGLDGPPDWSARLEEHLYGKETDAAD